MGEATGETRRIVEPLLTTDGEQQHGRLHDHGHDVSAAAGFPSVLASGMIFATMATGRLWASAQPGCNHRHGHDGPQMPEASASGPPDATGKAMMPKGP